MFLLAYSTSRLAVQINNSSNIDVAVGKTITPPCKPNRAHIAYKHGNGLNEESFIDS
jgi:hypothetical protein